VLTVKYGGIPTRHSLSYLRGGEGLSSPQQHHKNTIYVEVRALALEAKILQFESQLYSFLAV